MFIGRMGSQENVRLEIEEPTQVQIEQTISTKKTGACSWCRRLFNFHDTSNEKHHRPVFIIVMSILHVSIHLLLYMNIEWNGRTFKDLLYDLGMLFLPCMRPTPDYMRTRNVTCRLSTISRACSYDNELKRVCSSFMYPHQLWRLITANLLHLNLFHLLYNTGTQCLHGIPLEYKYGSVRIFAIYWLSELGSTVTQMVKDPKSCKFLGRNGLVNFECFSSWYWSFWCFIWHNVFLDRGSSCGNTKES